MMEVDNMICLDFSPEMVEIAKKRNKMCIVGDALNLPFPDNSFDCVISQDNDVIVQSGYDYYLHKTPEGMKKKCIDDRRKCLEEMKRVCKSQGKIVVICPNKFRVNLNSSLKSGPHEDRTVSYREIKEALTFNKIKNWKFFGIHVLPGRITNLVIDFIFNSIGLGILGYRFILSAEKD